MRRRWLIGVTIGVVILLGFIIFMLTSRPRINLQDTPTTARVERIDMAETVASTGHIEAERNAYLAFGVNGTVQNITVSVGDSVGNSRA